MRVTVLHPCTKFEVRQHPFRICGVISVSTLIGLQTLRPLNGANFQLATPLHAGLRVRHVRDREMSVCLTDGQADDAHQRSMPTLCMRGVISWSNLIVVLKMYRRNSNNIYRIWNSNNSAAPNSSIKPFFIFALWRLTCCRFQERDRSGELLLRTELDKKHPLRCRGVRRGIVKRRPSSTKHGHQVQDTNACRAAQRRRRLDDQPDVSEETECRSTRRQVRWQAARLVELHVTIATYIQWQWFQCLSLQCHT